MNIHFRYKKVWRPHSKTRRLAAVRPIIPITICHRSAKIKYEALIDSGADLNIFDFQLGGLIGLDVPKGEKRFFGGITGQKAVAYFHDVTLAVDNFEIETICGFSEDISLDGYGILGQNGFFNHFKVVFDRTSEKVKLTPKLKH